MQLLRRDQKKEGIERVKVFILHFLRANASLGAKTEHKPPVFQAFPYFHSTLAWTTRKITGFPSELTKHEHRHETSAGYGHGGGHDGHPELG